MIEYVVFHVMPLHVRVCGAEHEKSEINVAKRAIFGNIFIFLQKFFQM